MKQKQQDHEQQRRLGTWESMDIVFDANVSGFVATVMQFLAFMLRSLDYVVFKTVDCITFGLFTEI